MSGLNKKQINVMENIKTLCELERAIFSENSKMLIKVKKNYVNIRKKKEKMLKLFKGK